jgi:acyl-homoserine lactone acylase PvdQ
MTVKTCVVLCAALCLVTAGSHQIGAQGVNQPAKVTLVRAERALAQHAGAIVVRGVRAPVEVLRDSWGVSHI